MKNYFRSLLVFIGTALFLFRCGTLGAFEERTFPVSKAIMEMALDTLYYKYPGFTIPKKWKHFDNWTERGYGFLESRIFYFNNVPEEMYYVTFKGDSATLANATTVTIAIRAVNNGSGRWNKSEDFGKNEAERIQLRFDTEIVTRLEAIVAK